ncbi:enoyl-CoA hydratase/isomerase family protein [Chelatococcus sp. GCM10030263]|uniref:enoyl-CoA hydratase/isomerase family protein n=1 Tax=Chelatococcus sp. GCM10030263 TaxID=3273387 RepID=UPI00361A4910
MDLQTCRLEVADFIATVTMDRPPVNAQNRRLREEMTWLFDSLSDREDVRVVILTAAGKIFSAGADIKERPLLAADAGAYIGHNRLTREFFYAVSDCTKPVICAANGPAIGAGFALMLYCDIMLCVEDSWVSMPELDVGLAGGGKLMMEHFGRSWSRLIYFTGRKIPAAELYRQGVVSACVPREALMDEARTIAREIAAKSPLAVKWVKRGFTVAEDLPPREAYRYEQTITHDLSRTRDTKEAQAAFAEKRKPAF